MCPYGLPENPMMVGRIDITKVMQAVGSDTDSFAHSWATIFDRDPIEKSNARLENESALWKRLRSALEAIRVPS